MPDQSRNPTFGSDLAPVRVKDINDRTRDTRPDPKPKLEEESLDIDIDEQIANLAASSRLWEHVEEIAHEEAEQQQKKGPKLGRPREFEIAVALLAYLAKPLFRSERAMIKRFNNRRFWRWLEAVVRHAWPDHPNRRLPMPKRTKNNKWQLISRSQFRNFIRDHLIKSNEGFERLFDRTDKLGIGAAVHMGMLKTRHGSHNNPVASRYVYADQTFLRGRYRALDQRPPPKPNAPPPRVDPDAVTYNGRIKENKGSVGHNILRIGIRNDHYGEKLPLFMAVKPPNITEARFYINNLKRLLDNHDQVRKGLLGGVYDMAVHGYHIDEIYDLGIMPIGKVPLTNSSQVQHAKRPGIEFTLPKGTTPGRDLHLVDDTPALEFLDFAGYPTYQPLRRIDAYRRRRKGRWRWYGTFQVPANTPMPNVAGATATIRLDSTQDERDGPAKPRVLALRGLATSDRRFWPIFTIRETAENDFSTAKRELLNRRARSETARRVDLDLIAHQTNEIITGILFHHRRTGADVSRWFGKHNPLPRDGPLLQAA